MTRQHMLDVETNGRGLQDALWRCRNFRRSRHQNEGCRQAGSKHDLAYPKEKEAQLSPIRVEELLHPLLGIFYLGRGFCHFATLKAGATVMAIDAFGFV